MEELVDKLRNIQSSNQLYNWTQEEQRKLLELYLIISKKESYIFDLVYRYHQCDSWEDIFRDYSCNYLDEKASGVQVAIDNLENN